jgi:hypothetical protein
MIHETTWSVWPDAEMNELIEKVHHEYQWTIIYSSPEKPFIEHGTEPTFRSAYASMKQAEAVALIQNNPC